MISMLTSMLGGNASGGGGATDPDWASVTSLLHFDGANTSTTFTDQTARTWTANGNAQLDTSQSLSGGSSGSFDGNGDYIITSAFGFNANQAFTIEFFVRLNTLTGWQILAGQGSSLLFNFNHSGAPGKMQGVVNSNQVNGTTTLAAGTWYHVALTRDTDGTVRLFVGGALEASITGITAAVPSAQFYIGCIPPYGGDTLALNGRMEEFRITTGVARYTATFTPPTPPFPDA